jgi:hypothetical protein
MVEMSNGYLTKKDVMELKAMGYSDKEIRIIDKMRIKHFYI